MTGSKVFLDSNIWLGYFLGNIPRSKTIIESTNQAFCSVISLHEIAKRMIDLGKNAQEVQQALEFVEEKSIVVEVTRTIALLAVDNCRQFSLHTIDSLIFSSAQANNAVFITADNDFAETPNTQIVRRDTE